MGIKSIEKQEDIVTVKMTMPIKCYECPYVYDDCLYPMGYCVLFGNSLDEKERYKANISNCNTIPEFCPLRCNNG